MGMEECQTAGRVALGFKRVFYGDFLVFFSKLSIFSR